MDSLWSHLLISRVQVAEVVVATITLYSVFVLVLRTWGPRLRASTSTVSIAALTVLGAVVGRSMLGDVPNLSGGLIALGVLVVLETLARRLRGRHPAEDPQGSLAVVVEGRLRDEALEAAHLSEVELMVRLRERGVTHLADVALAVLEPSGGVTVVPSGTQIDQELVADLVGASALPDTVVRRAPSPG